MDKRTLPPEAAARRRTRRGEPFYPGKRWRDEDMPALGWRHRQHSFSDTALLAALETALDLPRTA